MDNIAEEQRVEVRLSVFEKTIRESERGKLLEAMIRDGVPTETLAILTGKNPELEGYKKFGLTPDDIDKLIREKKDKEDGLDQAEKTIKTLERLSKEEREAKDEEIAKLEAELKKAWKDLEEAKKQQPTDTSKKGKPAKEKPKEKLDIGKIRALCKVGWSLSKIGDEMGVSGQTIANALQKAGDPDEDDGRNQAGDGGA